MLFLFFLVFLLHTYQHTSIMHLRRSHPSSHEDSAADRGTYVCVFVVEEEKKRGPSPGINKHFHLRTSPSCSCYLVQEHSLVERKAKPCSWEGMRLSLATG